MRERLREHSAVHEPTFAWRIMEAYSSLGALVLRSAEHEGRGVVFGFVWPAVQLGGSLLRGCRPVALCNGWAQTAS